MEALRFWSDPTSIRQGVPLGHVIQGQILTTDASNLQRGGVLGEVKCLGLWSQSESLLHVNPLAATIVLRMVPQLRSHSGSDRQSYSPVLSEQDGRDQVLFARSVNLGDRSLVSGQGHHSHRNASVRRRQCQRRSSVSPAHRSSASFGEISRVHGLLTRE